MDNGYWVLSIFVLILFGKIIYDAMTTNKRTKQTEERLTQIEKKISLLSDRFSPGQGQDRERFKSDFAPEVKADFNYGENKGFAAPNQFNSDYRRNSVLTKEQYDQILALLPDQLIKAIKLYREITGVNLREAKERVEQIAREK